MMGSMRTGLRLVIAALAPLLAVADATAREVVRFRVEDTIQPASQQYIERVLELARTRDAGLIVMELDTPGGLLPTTREITSAITTSTIPVVVYVSPGGAYAASAGFFILISADLAAMAPGTNTGAAHPVTGKGGDIEGDMREKVTNDTAAMVRSLASARGRNVDLAVEAVTASASYTADEALEKNLIDLVAPDFHTLLEEIAGRTVKRFDGQEQTLDFDAGMILTVEPTTKERLFSLLANPEIAYILLGLASLGLMVEIFHPGAIFPGVVGVICLLLGLYGVSVLSVSWAGVALIFVALVMFMLEVKVTSYGLLTVGGLVSFILGSLMLFEGPIPAMRVSIGVVLPTALIIAGTTVFLLGRVIRAHQRRPVTGTEGLVGKVGTALRDLDPDGKVLVHGEYWDAHALGEAPIPAGSAVSVIAVGDRRIDVERHDSGREES
jgi:membrane-bound serine protease (ClpP class)